MAPVENIPTERLTVTIIPLYNNNEVHPARLCYLSILPKKPEDLIVPLTRRNLLWKEARGIVSPNFMASSAAGPCPHILTYCKQ